MNANQGNVEASEPVTPSVFEGDLRDLPRAPDLQPGAPEIEIPRLTYPRGDESGASAPANPPAGGPDPLLEVQAQASATGTSRVFGTPDLNFAGQAYTGVVPPDPVGEVGLNYYIQMTNHPSGSIFTIYNKATGTVAAPAPRCFPT